MQYAVRFGSGGIHVLYYYTTCNLDQPNQLLVLNPCCLFPVPDRPSFIHSFILSSPPFFFFFLSDNRCILPTTYLGTARSGGLLWWTSGVCVRLWLRFFPPIFLLWSAPQIHLIVCVCQCLKRPLPCSGTSNIDCSYESLPTRPFYTTSSYLLYLNTLFQVSSTTFILHFVLRVLAYFARTTLAYIQPHTLVYAVVRYPRVRPGLLTTTGCLSSPQYLITLLHPALSSLLVSSRLPEAQVLA